MNADTCKGWFSGDLKTLPNKSSWRCTSMSEAALQHARCKTAVFGTRETKEGGIPVIRRRHRFWKPSRRRRSAAERHKQLRPYISLDSTSFVNMNLPMNRKRRVLPNFLQLSKICFRHPDAATKLMSGQTCVGDDGTEIVYARC